MATTPILNIEHKEDSPGRLASIAGQPSKYYLSAGETNTIVAFCKMLRSLCIVNGSNIKAILDKTTKVELGEVADFIAELNEKLPSLFIAPVFITYTIDGIDYVQAFVGQKSNYGLGKRQFVEADFVLIYQSDVQQLDSQNRIPKILTDEITPLLQSDSNKILYPDTVGRVVLVQDGFDFNSNYNRYIIDTSWSKQSAILKIEATGMDFIVPTGQTTTIGASPDEPYLLECPPNTITIFGKTAYDDNIVISQQVCNPLNGRPTKNIYVDYTGNPDAFFRLNNEDKYKTLFPMGYVLPSATIPVTANIVLDNYSDILFQHGDEFIIDTTYYKCAARLKIYNTNPIFDVSLPGNTGGTVGSDGDGVFFDCPADTITKLKIDTDDFVIHISQQSNGMITTIANNYATDAAAALAGIPIGGFYHKDGNVKIRLS